MLQSMCIDVAVNVAVVCAKEWVWPCCANTRSTLLLLPLTLRVAPKAPVRKLHLCIVIPDHKRCRTVMLIGRWWSYAEDFVPDYCFQRCLSYMIKLVCCACTAQYRGSALPILKI